MSKNRPTFQIQFCIFGQILSEFEKIKFSNMNTVNMSCLLSGQYRQYSSIYFAQREIPSFTERSDQSIWTGWAASVYLSIRAVITVRCQSLQQPREWDAKNAAQNTINWYTLNIAPLKQYWQSPPGGRRGMNCRCNFQSIRILKWDFIWLNTISLSLSAGWKLQHSPNKSCCYPRQERDILCISAGRGNGNIQSVLWKLNCMTRMAGRACSLLVG